jgi:hypothetical protein
VDEPNLPTNDDEIHQRYRQKNQTNLDLKGDSYVGKFVISQAKIYSIDPNGRVSEVGDTSIILD